MRETPYAFTVMEFNDKDLEKQAKVKEPEAPAKETPAPQAPPKTFMQRYGIFIAVAAIVAAIWFFMKYKVVPKVAAVAA